MSYSLNEIESMCKRAARGAGMHWGLAEEAGKAARWMSAHNLLGAEKTAAVLIRNDAKNYDEIAPVSIDGIWRAVSGDLCPLVVGVALCDRAVNLMDGDVIEIGSIAHPILLAPFAAAAAKLTNAEVELSWMNVEITASPNSSKIIGEPAALYAETVASVRCMRAENPSIDLATIETRREVDRESWDQLNAFAQRTYVPATDASRVAGAGAGLVDTD